MLQKIQIGYSKLEHQIAEINAKTAKITKNTIDFFKPISIKIRFTSEEACFLSLINWAYCLKNEVSKCTLDFIIGKIIDQGNLNVDISVLDFIDAERTVLNHNLDPKKSHDAKTINFSEDWFQVVIGKKSPEINDDYGDCVIKIVDELSKIFDVILKYLSWLESTEFADFIISEWNQKYLRHFPKHMYASVLDKVLTNFGYKDFIDFNSYLDKNLNCWRNKVALLNDGFDFERSCARIIEQSIIEEGICPIDGQDLIDADIPRGPIYKELLLFARKQFSANPCSKEDLIILVKEFQLITETQKKPPYD